MQKDTQTIDAPFPFSHAIFVAPGYCHSRLEVHWNRISVYYFSYLRILGDTSCNRNSVLDVLGVSYGAKMTGHGPSVVARDICRNCIFSYYFRYENIRRCWIYYGLDPFKFNKSINSMVCNYGQYELYQIEILRVLDLTYMVKVILFKLRS
jgi:hypothetical protein